MITIEATTLCQLIDELAEQGQLPALISTAGHDADTLSRQALLEQVQQLAAGLLHSGISKGDVVALLAENRFEWIAVALAVIRVGALILPIDSQTSDANLTHILTDSGVRLLFTNGDHLARLRQLELAQPPHLIVIDDPEPASGWQRLMSAETLPMPACRPEDNAVLFYTSGTTGRPKGVPLTHRNLMFEIRSIVAANLINEHDRLLLPLPLHHVYPFVMSMLAPIGARLPVILPKGMTGPDILRAIQMGGVTTVVGVPRLFRALYSGIQGQVEQRGVIGKAVFQAGLALSRLAKRRFGLSIGKALLRPLHRKFGESLRLMASGGSALDPELAANLEALGWQVGSGYGLTETSPLITLKLPDVGPANSVGQPLPGIEVRIRPLDAVSGDQAADAGSAAPGEVQIRGPNVFNGYWQLEEKTRESFTEDGWFRTGDLGYLDEQGYLFLQGRASTLIVTESGKNVQPDELEEHYALHPLIAEIGVLEDNGRLVALIIPDAHAIKSSARDEDEAIREAVAEQGRKLPSYQRLADFSVIREALPRTRLGKIQRHLLKAQYQQHAQQGTSTGHRVGLLPVEEMSDQDHALLDNSHARRVWEWLGRRYPDHRITPDTRVLLDLRIDSLELLNLTMDIAQLTGVELEEQSLGRVETVRDLLHEVSTATGSGRALDPARIVHHPEDYLSAEQSRYLKPFNPVEAIIAFVGRGLAWLVMKTYFRLTVTGRDHLPSQGAFILTPNHASFLDPIALFAATPLPVLRQTYFAGWTGIMFRNALMRFGGRIGKTVPIDPNHAAASSLALGAIVLKQGNSLIWFPEGERSSSGELMPFKPGIGLLLKHQPVTVVPVGIFGAEHAMPVGQRFPRPRAISVTFGEPVTVAELLDRESEEPEHEQIRRNLHARLASILDDQEQGVRKQ